MLAIIQCEKLLQTVFFAAKKTVRRLLFYKSRIEIQTRTPTGSLFITNSNTLDINFFLFSHKKAPRSTEVLVARTCLINCPVASALTNNTIRLNRRYLPTEDLPYSCVIFGCQSGDTSS